MEFLFIFLKQKNCTHSNLSHASIKVCHSVYFDADPDSDFYYENNIFMELCSLGGHVEQLSYL